MSLSKADLERRAVIIRMMQSTAKRNGKRCDYQHIERVANRLHRMETTLCRLAEDQCSYPVYDSQKQERTEERAVKLIKEMIGCECYTQRDPRGFMIRMYLVDENGKKWFNSWDGETTGLAW